MTELDKLSMQPGSKGTKATTFTCIAIPLIPFLGSVFRYLRLAQLYYTTTTGMFLNFFVLSLRKSSKSEEKMEEWNTAYNVPLQSPGFYLNLIKLANPRVRGNLGEKQRLLRGIDDRDRESNNADEMICPNFHSDLTS